MPSEQCSCLRTLRISTQLEGHELLSIPAAHKCVYRGRTNTEFGKMTKSKDIEALVRSRGNAVKKLIVVRRRTVKRRQPRVRKEIQLAHPDFPHDQWSVFDQHRACAEGWAIYEAVREEATVLEIEKNDINDPPHEGAPTHSSDEAAVRHVAKTARAGSRRHQRAMAIHRKHRARLNALRRKARRDAARAAKVASNP